MMHVFVINLDRSAGRLANMSAHLQRLGLNFTRISAVDGSALTTSQRTLEYSPDKNRKTYRRALSNGEIGCYLSHRACWQRIVDDHLDVALVLEDDAVLHEHLPGLLTTIEQLSSPWDLIKLCDPQKNKKAHSWRPLNQNFQLSEYKKLPSGAIGYAVSSHGAAKLVEARATFGRPVDDDMQFYWEYQGLVFGVEPSPIWHSEATAGSDIDASGRRQRSKTLWSALKTPILRLAYEINILHHHSKRQRPNKGSEG
ncbi:MAG: glycosyltransferase family 25 protein [Cellvibrionales bacterium]